MNEDEQRGYSKGYAAGRRRVERELTDAKILNGKATAWLSAFNSALPAVIGAQGWTKDQKPITSLPARSELAADFADQAVKQLIKRYGSASLCVPESEQER